MTLSQIFAKLNAFNAEVALLRNNYRYTETSERWGCSITVDNDGTEIKVRCNAADGDEALRLAFEKFDTLMNSKTVAKTLNLPLLSAPEEVA
jgi:hypothetical protein